MTERRFNDAEVAAIFERAAEAQHTSQPLIPLSKGMTLVQLQDIGREIGISPDELARAAKAVELQPQPASREFMGLPIGVGLTVDLDRKLTEEEWDRFVVDLRETFDAQGTVTHEGSFRQWSNGNLQALLEPTATGHRVRLRTVKGDARGLIIGGLCMFGFAALAFIAALFRGPLDDGGFIAAVGFLAVMGAGMFGMGAFRLPGWARLRRQQMAQVAERLAVEASSSALPDMDGSR